MLQKGGEVLQALQRGLLQPEDIQAELAAQAGHSWGRNDADITVYKSVGFAALDLIAAEQVMAHQQHHRQITCAA